MKQDTQIKSSTKFHMQFVALVFVISTLILINLESIHSFYKSYKVKMATQEVTKIEEKKDNNVILHNTHEETLELNNSLAEEIDKEKLQRMELHDMEHYRGYLVHTAKLVSKFLSNIDYQEEIEYLLQHSDKYTKDIHDALLKLKAHNDTYLQAKQVEYKTIKLKGNFIKKSLNKLVHISQENPEFHAMERDAKDLQNEINLIEKYFYSIEFLKYYLNYD